MPVTSKHDLSALEFRRAQQDASDRAESLSGIPGQRGCLLLLFEPLFKQRLRLL